MKSYKLIITSFHQTESKTQHEYDFGIGNVSKLIHDVIPEVSASLRQKISSGVGCLVDEIHCSFQKTCDKSLVASKQRVLK